MSSDISLPTKRSTMPVRASQYIQLFYGPPGVGKTTFVNGFGEKVLFLSTDHGTRTINSMRVECETWDDFAETCDKLNDKDAPKYDFVCIDHIEDMTNLAEDWVCEHMRIESLSDASYGKGWKAYKKALNLVIRSLMQVGAGVVFIAHEDIKTVKSRSIELERTMPAMSKSAWRAIIPLCDLVGYCGFTTIKTEGGRKEVRTLTTTPREDLYAKDRTKRNRPQVELLNPAEFVKTFGESNNGQGQGQEGERPRGRRARH